MLESVLFNRGCSGTHQSILQMQSDHQSYARIVISLIVTKRFDGDYGPGKVDTQTHPQFNCRVLLWAETAAGWPARGRPAMNYYAE